MVPSINKKCRVSLHMHSPVWPPYFMLHGERQVASDSFPKRFEGKKTNVQQIILHSVLFPVIFSSKLFLSGQCSLKLPFLFLSKSIHL